MKKDVMKGKEMDDTALNGPSYSIQRKEHWRETRKLFKHLRMLSG